MRPASFPLCSLLLLLALACLPGCNAVHLQQRYIEYRWSSADIHGHLLALPSGRMRYYSGGDGFPVLFIHGFGFSAPATWKDQMVALSRSHRVIAPDLYWFGDSVPDKPMDTAAEQADGIIELMDRLGLCRAHIVGVSYGGFVALQLALRHGDRVARLVLIDAAGLQPTPEEEHAVAATFSYARGEVARLLIPEDTRQLRMFLDRVFYRAPYIPGLLLGEVLAEFWRNREAKVRMCRALMAGGFLRPEDLSAISAPVLILWGRYDRLLLPSIGMRMARSIRGARLVLMEQSGHSPMLEQPLQVDRLLLAFLVP